MKDIFKFYFLVALIGIAFLAGCSLGAPKEIEAENFRGQFEIVDSARGATFIGTTKARAYAETTELIGLRPFLGFGPDIKLVWTPLSDFTAEEQKSLSAGKVPWSPFVSRIPSP